MFAWRNVTAVTTSYEFSVDQPHFEAEVTSSVTRPAALIRAWRMVSNWASRQNEVLGARPRKVCRSQKAAVWTSSRNWLAVALLQEVRSEARCSLCALIRFSAWPRAQ